MLSFSFSGGNFMFSQIYGQSLSLLTDLYQLTMAYGYWQSGAVEKEAVFNLSFRVNPFKGGFAVFCGLTHVIDFLQNFSFDQSDIDYLSTINASDGTPLFSNAFLQYLLAMKLTVDIDAMPEGAVVFAHEPLLRVKGPLIQCQILETILLNIVNFQSLIATKAARVRLSAGDKSVVEFGLRRAQGADGALSASWASYIGGVDGTSNVLAGKLFDIPVIGTHAHSWVMSFDDELEAFRTYAQAMPNNCVFLVDTYDSLEGVKKAVEIGRWLRSQGHELMGIRLDSGDLAYLSIEARKILNEGGFEKALIVASNDLDEHIIASLNDQGACIDIWAVGTKLVTAYDQPALGGVYKLTALRNDAKSAWQYKIKLSEQSGKITSPGLQQVRRFYDSSGTFTGDCVYDQWSCPDTDWVIVDPVDFTRRKALANSSQFIDMLVPIFRDGNLVYTSVSSSNVRAYSKEQLQHFHHSIKRLLNPHQYPVGLERGLHDLKTDLILKLRQSK
jgi:nicotinate phosphoribosyltransferase